MIIGSNNNGNNFNNTFNDRQLQENNNFNTKMSQIKENNEYPTNNQFVENIHSMIRKWNNFIR